MKGGVDMSNLIKIYFILVSVYFIWITIDYLLRLIREKICRDSVEGMVIKKEIIEIKRLYFVYEDIIITLKISDNEYIHLANNIGYLTPNSHQNNFKEITKIQLYKNYHIEGYVARFHVPRILSYTLLD